MEAIKTTLSRQMKDRSGQEWKGNLYIHKGQDLIKSCLIDFALYSCKDKLLLILDELILHVAAHEFHYAKRSSNININYLGSFYRTILE
ncbi:hypothetical protein [Defluviitalea raffinosedens]|jgi:hypothetical protein|uniref:Uncharacterized protein n=2 Tax=Defluviitalea raffinosedens TaxID=1450156 RepID=A0A7C8LEF2_9FIRM|nr:hypothetical protein [Defluviitalea raffinosedens]KAE9634000.1 hypothetical protein GND95_07715 [Defluviitalea raffinosedens]MBM7685871.1 hypothetical protein [Defluviitalea raffinosedens]